MAICISMALGGGQVAMSLAWYHGLQGWLAQMVPLGLWVLGAVTLSTVMRAPTLWMEWAVVQRWGPFPGEKPEVMGGLTS